MTEDTSSGLGGVALEEAVDRLAGEDDDREAIEEALNYVAADGVVSEEGAERSRSDAAMALSTLQQRVADLTNRFEQALSMGMPAPDLEVARRRIDRFEERLDALESRRNDLATDIEAIQDAEEPGSLFEQGQTFRELAQRSRDIHDELQECATDLDRLERWLHEPRYRFEELAEEASALCQTVESLEEQVTALEEADVEAPEQTWLDATVRQRLAEVLLSDLRYEFEELKEASPPFDDPADGDPEYSEDIERDVETVTSSLDRLADRLDAVAEPEWIDEHEDALAELDDALAPLEPPMDWATVETVVEKHRRRIESLDGQEE